MRGLIGGANRITGLASGLDVDALVENMTKGTQMKIAKQLQSKQLLQWQMNDYRSISSKLIDFQEKYTSFSSSTNLRSQSFFGKTQVTTVGDNSKYISVSGSSPNAQNIRIESVKQLATKASAVSKDQITNQVLTSGVIDTNSVTTSSLGNATLTLKYNNQDFTIRLDGSKSYDKPEDLVNEINKQLSETEYKTKEETKKLSDMITVQMDGQNLSMKLTPEAAGTGNSVEITGGSETLLKTVGWKEGDKTDTGSIKGTEVLDEKKLQGLQSTRTFADFIGSSNTVEKTLSFSYNGKQVTIKMPTAQEIKDNAGADTNKAVTYIKDHLQTELNKAFGAGNVNVSLTGDQKLEFKTKDPSSTLDIVGGSDEVFRVLNLEKGATNRVNLNSSLKNSGLSLSDEQLKNIIQNGVTINGVQINKKVDGKAFDENTTMDDIITAINASDAGVKVSYIKEANKFSIMAKEEGEKEITFDDNAKALFHTVNAKDPDGTKYNKAGQDAIMYVDYDGEGGADAVELKRSSNSITVDGMTITVKGTFNENRTDPTQAVTFDAQVDSDKITNAVKEMITAFNDIIKLSNDELTEKRERDFQPLTEEQKKEMSEDEIKKWEEKAQKGMLFNSPELRQFTTDIRFLFSAPDKIQELEKMGITVSSDHKDHGKISFDESKFKAYLAKDSDKVAEIFAGPNGGIMNEVYDVFEKYAATTGATKGVFVEKAGSPKAPASMLNNVLLKEMNSMDKYVKELQGKLKRETESYYQRFASLETYISNMNAQSSWLAQQFAG